MLKGYTENFSASTHMYTQNLILLQSEGEEVTHANKSFKCGKKMEAPEAVAYWKCQKNYFICLSKMVELGNHNTRTG